MGSRLRAFTLIEATITVAIFSIGAALAAPSFVQLANVYRAREGARAVMLAVGNARALSQKLNEAVRVTVLPGRIEVARPRFSSVVATIHYVNGWTPHKDFAVANAVISTVPTANGEVPAGPAASFIFCPTSDGTYLTTQEQTLLCPLGEMASNGGRIRFSVLNQAFSVKIDAALAHLSLTTGT